MRTVKGNSHVREILAAARLSNIAIGQFFFRYRNVLFPLMFLFAAIVLRPKVLLLGSLAVNRFMIVLGIALAVLGQSFRLMTIGWEYIHRGGKDGKVYAARLVQRGMYGITRNPMYVGNALIATGMALTTCSPAAYGLTIPSFLFVYQAIMSAEEHYLRDRFGAQYEAYCARVDRMIPSVHLIPQAFSGMRYNLRRALRHDLATITGLVIGLIALPVWRIYFLDGLPAARTAAVRALGLSCGVGLLYAVLLHLKRRKRLFYQAAERSKAEAETRNRTVSSAKAASEIRSMNDERSPHPFDPFPVQKGLSRRRSRARP
jgi:protein-S-isoprenylcysteine O-methyltransferase Ste14